MGQISAKICCCEAFSSRCGQRRFTTTRNYRNHEIQYCIAFPGLLSRIVGSQHPASRASLAEEEKRKLCLNEVWGRRSPNFWTKQSSFLFCLVKLVFFECELPFIFKPMVITEPAEASARLKAWVRNYISATCRACSTKLFLDSCRIFHK